MKEDKFDSILQEAMDKKTTHLLAPSYLKENIDREINNHKEEIYIMKRFGWKKVTVAVVAICTFCTIAAVAAGKVTGLVSSSNSTDNQYPIYADLDKAETKLGYPIQSVEGFSNGFSYDRGNIAQVDGIDDDSNVVTSYSELTMDYKNKAGDAIWLYISRPTELIPAEEKPGQETTEVDGIIMSYNRDRYKFFPPNATPSEEDLKAEAAGELYISYGSQEIEEMFFYHASWEQDGTKYALMSSGMEFTSAEMFQMAKEIIEAK